MVYFIQSGDDGPIKIGFATEVASRLSELQTGCPAKLHLLGKVRGSMQLEKDLHALFAGLRISGEWFRPDPSIFEKINELKKQFGEALSLEERARSFREGRTDWGKDATHSTLPPRHVIVRIAAAANADERTVRRVLLGETVKGYVRERIDIAIKAAGLAPAQATAGK